MAVMGGGIGRVVASSMMVPAGMSAAPTGQSPFNIHRIGRSSIATELPSHASVMDWQIQHQALPGVHLDRG
jgi:hypothetical protein